MATRTVVLGYHAVSENWPDSLAVPPENLRRQVRWLLDRGYEGTTFYDAVMSPAPTRRFAITFDDGFRSVFAEGFPVLESLGVPATVFTNISLVDAEEIHVGPSLTHWIGGPHEHELRSATWDELRELAAAGWEIGAHSVTHPLLTQLDDTDLDWELTESRRRMEQELGRPCRTMAYPSGDVDARVAAAAGRAGFELAATLPRRLPVKRDPLMWPRISISRHDTMARFRVKLSPGVQRLRQTAAWAPIDGLRRSIAR